MIILDNKDEEHYSPAWLRASTGGGSVREEGESRCALRAPREPRSDGFTPTFRAERHEQDTRGGGIQPFHLSASLIRCFFFFLHVFITL